MRYLQFALYITWVEFIVVKCLYSKVAHAHTHTHAHTSHAHTHTRTLITRTYTYTYSQTHTYIYIHTQHTHKYIHIHTHTYIHMHTHIYIYTHIHIHTTQLTNFIAWNRPSLSWTFTASNCVKEAYNTSYTPYIVAGDYIHRGTHS